MDFQIALILGQDGITNGAIYALLALALVLAFAVTRVIFIPQGEFVAYGALTLVALQAGKVVILECNDRGDYAECLIGTNKRNIPQFQGIKYGNLQVF